MNRIYDGMFFVMDLKDGKYKLTFHQDNDSEDPRTWDNPANMLCWHNNYNLGDTHNYGCIHDVLCDLCEQYGLDVTTICQYKSDEETPKQRDRRIIEDLKEYVCIKFLYLYDHSGITISLNDFKDPWDSGVVGIIYMDKTTTLKEFPNSNEDNWYVIAEQHLEDEVTEYDQWITGDVYAFSLDKLVKCPHCNHEEEEFVDSCGGFIGSDITTNGMMEYFPEDVVKFLKEVL